MRLIDYDAVIARIAGQMSYEIEAETGEKTDCLDLAEELLNDIPTIDADRPKGKWHHIRSVCYGGGTMNEVVCSKCHEHQILPTNFCPNCGAQMKGADDDL